MKTRIALSIFAMVACSAAHACSVCIAHMLGAALHGIGAQVLPKGKTVMGISHLTFTKSNGMEEPGEREFENYHETAIGIAYGISDRLMFGASIPYVVKSINSPEGRESTTGLGDASCGLVYQLKPTDSNPVLSSFSCGVKLPTGENSRRDETGEILEEHLQPGSGSTDIVLGYAFTLETGGFGSPLFYGGLQYRFNGQNSRHFQYGNALFYNLGLSRSIGKDVRANIEAVGRLSGKDKVGDGTFDENSGGHVLYIGLGLSTVAGKNLTASIGIQVPILQGLHGDQTERSVLTFGIAGRF